MTKEPTNYFIAWVSEDNKDKPAMPYDVARRDYMYRVFRDDGGAKAEPVTEAMTYKEAQVKAREIRLLTQGSNHE
jgi:hypothetical protein